MKRAHKFTTWIRPTSFRVQTASDERKFGRVFDSENIVSWARVEQRKCLKNISKSFFLFKTQFIGTK